MILLSEGCIRTFRWTAQGFLGILLTGEDVYETKPSVSIPRLDGRAELTPVPLGVTVFLDNEGVLGVHGSCIPRIMSCLLRTRDTATIAKVVLTAPIPQLNINAVVKGSVFLITRRYASR